MFLLELYSYNVTTFPNLNLIKCTPDLPDPGMGPVSLLSPVLAGRFLTTNTTWEAQFIYTTEYFSDMRKKDILLFVTTQMDFKGIMLHEISKTEK